MISIVLFFSSRQMLARHPIRNSRSNQSIPGRFDNIVFMVDTSLGKCSFLKLYVLNKTFDPILNGRRICIFQPICIPFFFFLTRRPFVKILYDFHNLFLFDFMDKNTKNNKI